MEGSNQTSQNQTGNNQAQSGFTDPVFAQEIHVAHENNPQNNAQNMNINPPQNNAGNNNINNYNNMQPQFQDWKNLGNNIPTHNINKDNNGTHVMDSFSQFTDKGQIEELSHRNQNQNNGPNQPNVNNSLSIFNQDNQQNMPSQNKSNANNNNNNNNNPTLNSNELNSSNFNEFNLLKTYKTKIKENTNQTGDNQPLANHSNQQNEPTYSQKQIKDIQNQNMNNNNPINSQNQGIIGNNNNALNSNAVIGNSTNNNMLNNQISNQAIINNDNQNLNSMNNFNKNENVMNNSLIQKNDNVGNSQNNNMSINNNNNNQQNPQLNISNNPPEVNNQNNPPQVNPFYQNNQPNNNMNNQMGNNNMNDQIGNNNMNNQMGNNNMNNQMGSINMNDKQVNNNPMGINNQNNQLGNNNINNPMGINNFNNPRGNNNFNNPMGINNQNNQLGNMNAQSNNNNNFNKPTNPEVQPQQQNNKPGEEEYRFTRYKKPALTVLKNLGNTSYLNAVLQLFGTVRNLASYFVNPKNRKYFEEHLKEIPLAFVFHRLFLHLYPYPEKATGEKYNPEVLLQILGQYNAVYKSKEVRNPNDLINFILIQMHRELNTNKIKYINEPDCTKKEQVIKIGMEDFLKSNNSILAKNFIWFEIKTKLCPSCKTCYYEFNHFETLELDIASAYQKYNAPLNLCQTLFYQNQKNQKIYCLREQQYTMANVTSKIYSPNYFIFSLNRGNFDTNLMKIPFNLEQEIDISKLLDNPQSYKKFELIGVVSISTAENKKYVCFGRSPVNYKWYLYNDDHSAENTDINNVVKVHNSGQYIPCILMYQCKK